ANALTQSAANDAKRLTTTPQGAASLLAAANAKRLGAERIAAKSSPKPAPKKAAPKPAPKRPAPKAAAPKAAAPKAAPAAPRALAAPAVIMRSEADLLQRARQGRVRSNVNQAVSDSQLLAAHRSGRVYWVQ